MSLPVMKLREWQLPMIARLESDPDRFSVSVKRQLQRQILVEMAGFVNLVSRNSPKTGDLAMH